MVVMVKRDFYGNGKLVRPSDLSLGSCPPGAQTTDPNVMFEADLQDCGSSLEMTPDWLIYSVNLRYTPSSPRNVPISRFNSAVVPIHCYYPRHGNVSSKAIKPTWIPFSSTVTSEERLAFSLRLMTADWSAPSQSLVFQLGDMFYIEASLDTQNHAPMILFVDSCVATITPDVTSTPRYEIISNNGCLMDGMQEDSSSVFVSPRPQADTLRFIVDAFRFTDSSVSLIYITCSLRAAAIDQTPDPVNKACSYNKASSSWIPVEGSSGICQCCATGNCAASTGPRSAWGSYLGRPRGLGKRDVGSQVEEHGLATLGPLLVTGAKPNQEARAGTAQASRMGAGQEPLQLWVLVAIGSVSTVVVAVALTVVDIPLPDDSEFTTCLACRPRIQDKEEPSIQDVVIWVSDLVKSSVDGLRDSLTQSRKRPRREEGASPSLTEEGYRILDEVYSSDSEAEKKEKREISL
ncbi:zona pellucida sperm-binding protein 3-like [Dendropsophus ebraccatus]|uniref:zona pellucida sperm-binding protein 3-like n=1 Tax=Dendropsophus ebraccatus TaxID=150705 RepID=UPI0038321E10